MKEEIHMDHGTRCELDNLLHGYQEALIDIQHGIDDEERVAAWRKAQTLTWRLHELLPSAIESLPA
jgi:hypothetical protein